MRNSFSAGIVLAILLPAVSSADAVAGKLPVIDGKETVATINGEPITLDEVSRGIAALHAEMGDYKKAGQIDYAGLLGRLITVRLILLDARNMGLDELPEAQELVDAYSKQALRELLLKQQTRDVSPDDKEVDRQYREAVQEYTMKSLLFEKEEAAKKIEKELAEGGSFDAVFGRVQAKTLQAKTEATVAKGGDLLPEIKDAVSHLEAGSISPVVRVPSGFVIVKLESIRVPEDPETRDRIRSTVLTKKRGDAANDFIEKLKKEYTRVDQTVLDSLNFEAETPGFDALLTDPRVVTEITGEDPVTVGMLAEALKKKFFHGVDTASSKKRLNSRKTEVLHDILRNRVLAKEAVKRGLDQSNEYKGMVDDHRRSVIFGLFVQKAVLPNIHVQEKDLTAYYKKHVDDFSSPEMMKMRDIVFEKKGDAESALGKLRKGTDFGWLAANAQGQVDPSAKGLMRFENNLVMTNGLPEDVRKTLAGSRAGDYRLYESPEHYFYVLVIQDIVAPKPEPFKSRRDEIRRIVFNEKTTKAVEDWAEKLKKYYPVKIYEDFKKPQP